MIIIYLDLMFKISNFSIQEKDEKLKTVEELLETGLIQVATKEEELNVKHFIVCFPYTYSIYTKGFCCNCIRFSYTS
jgi:hypothetical protein